MATITNPASNRTQAVFLKAHIKMLCIGMKNSQFSQRQILSKITALTGNSYPSSPKGRGRALSDITHYVEEGRV